MKSQPQAMNSAAGSIAEMRLPEGIQLVPQTPQQQFMFASPLLVASQQLQTLPQPEYYRRMSLPAHLTASQINPLVQYSQIQTDLMNSFNSPYNMLQKFGGDDGQQPSFVNSMTRDGMNMFDAGTMYYETTSRAPTPYFEMPASMAGTPIASPVIQHKVVNPSTTFESTPPSSPEKKSNSRTLSTSSNTTTNNNSSDKKNRFKATEAELPILSAVFEKNPFPSAVLRKKLADRLGLEVKQIQFWFQNRRATLKINGIHVIKPKKTSTPSASFKPKPALSPLTEGNPYFFVEHNAARPEEFDSVR
ncbi:UNVERIFIED_CONTAM: hypothetical protein HDU68_009074 [Siphonaria sp. JEL0065]|nr:hypothetical protein HDU68_009074 [Siphonaria sp. JEL0065]